MKYTIVDTPWGDFAFVTRSGRVVSSYLLGRRRTILARIVRAWPEATFDAKALPNLQEEVLRYFDGEPVSLDVPIDLGDVSPFRRRVLETCREIPYGQTSSYGELAQFAGSPAAARAVGGAMAHNPIPLIVPCHRVLRSDGSLGGFTSPQGTDLKRRMLIMERQSSHKPLAAPRPFGDRQRQRGQRAQRLEAVV